MGATAGAREIVLVSAELDGDGSDWGGELMVGSAARTEVSLTLIVGRGSIGVASGVGNAESESPTPCAMSVLCRNV